jgi:endonuclease-3
MVEEKSGKPKEAASRPRQAKGARAKRRLPATEAARIEAIFARLAKANPEPKGELYYTNPFTLLVAVVLSAQATDAGVNKATPALFAMADTPQKMVALGEERVREAIKTIGLFRNKAKNVVALSRILVEHHGGEVPQTREALTALPGVGRKTANVVLNIAFRQPTIAVDTHLFRISNRLPLAKGATPEAVEAGLEAVVPAQYLLHAHHWLILHGRYVCKARKPECGRCILFDLCRFKDKTA